MEEFLISDLTNLPVGLLSEQKRLGSVSRALIHPFRLQLIGVLVRLAWWQKERYVPFEEIIEIEKEGLLVQDEETLILPDEVIQAAELLKNKSGLLGWSVRTKSGKYLGRIYDGTFQRLDGKIKKIYLSHFFYQRIIPRRKIIHIKPKCLIVEEDELIAGAPSLFRV